jgi:D-tyrosyl-tRNA(Tyr) deacylase
VRTVLQRVSSASVDVDGREVARIGAGALLLIGVEKGDESEAATQTVRKLAGLRVFEDAAGRMNLSAAEVGAEFLVVSQFTLAAALDRGRRPSFDRAAPPEAAEPLVELVATRLEDRGFQVGRGVFGARMRVELVNDGPVTFVLDA